MESIFKEIKGFLYNKLNKLFCNENGYLFWVILV